MNISRVNASPDVQLQSKQSFEEAQESPPQKLAERLKPLRTLLIALATVAMISISSWSADTHLGKGCTTAFVIDEDCDGYGVGPGMPPDADDSHAAVNTSASALSKYGTVGSFLTPPGYSHTNSY